MALTYQSGEDIQLGNRVTYGGNAGTVELVVEGLTGDPETDRPFEPTVLASWSQSQRCSGAFTSPLLMKRRTDFSWPDRNERSGNATLIGNAVVGQFESGVVGAGTLIGTRIVLATSVRSRTCLSYSG